MRRLQNFLVLVIALFFPFNITASSFKETNKSVICGSLNEVISSLTQPDIAETPMWVGKDPEYNTHFTIFVNEKTGSFTILQFDKESACVLGVGTGFRHLYRFTKNRI